MKKKDNILFFNSIFWNYIKNLKSFRPLNISLALALMVLTSLTEGIGLLLLIPLLHLVGINVQQGALGQIDGFIASIFSYFGTEPTLPMVLIIYVAIISLNALFVRLQTITTSQIEYDYAAHIRKRLFKAITNSNWLFFTSKRSSDFAHALTYEIERITTGTSYFITLISSSIVLSVYIFFALKISGIITEFIFVVGIILLLLLKKRTQKAGESGEKLSDKSKEMYSSTLKQMDGMKTIKSFGMEEKNIEMFSSEVNQVSASFMGTVKSYADVRFLFDVGSVVILSAVVFILIQIMGISTAELLILLFLFIRIIPRFSWIQMSYQYFINMLPAFKTVVDLESECLKASEPQLNRNNLELKDKIVFKGVSFSYQNESFTLKNLNLVIEAGKTTSLAGLSGAGKSTIADMVMGLIRPDEGKILVDNIPLNNENLLSWRNQIGYVAQDTFLFNDTVRNNLLFANPEAGKKEILEALQLASADKFVLKLPDGLDTIIGDRGVLLSGGEKQRLALARALLRKPSLLILDEVTSNLDSRNEKKIIDSLNRLHWNLTILIIAHRLSTIRNADIIYLIENGMIIESGNWNCLIQKGNGYLNNYKMITDDKSKLDGCEV
ncbi:ABC transporter ATP-binding protein [Methanobacterium oryzae]|uniref:ABC transporter ATP-binding protein n=1 Tax=Methanobacterium oryzae TaxID=69540 RepID=UPI003D192AA1